MALRELIDKLPGMYRRLFLVDGAAALTSAFLLGVVLVRFEAIFGIPPATLYFLASLPVLFFCYDMWFFLKPGNNPSRALKIIGLINLSYCLLSFALALYHFDSVTILGWAYILSEIAIVVVLALTELKTAAALRARTAKV